MAMHPKAILDAAAPWTIKSIPAEDKDFIIASARKEGLTVGQWISKRCKEWRADGSPVVVSPSAAPSMPDMAALIQALPALADAKGGSRIAAQARRALMHGLSAYVPPGHTPSRTENDAIEGPVENVKRIGRPK